MSAAEVANIPSYDDSEEIVAGAKTALIDRDFPSSTPFQPQFIFNDSHRGRKVIATIEAELAQCSSFDFSVAFITRSGITPLLPVLQKLEKAGVPGRILTTDYLAFSEPQALEKLARFSNIELRMNITEGSSSSQGFHTKGYIFHYENGIHKALVGSANLTGSALAVNNEWNFRLTSTSQGELFQEMQAEFEQLWRNSTSLANYIDTYRQIYADKKRVLSQQKVAPFEQVTLEPNSMQIAFTEKLRAMIEDGKTRALLISATGTGKTYASAFAVRALQRKPVLFLAHREQILRQALNSYRRVLGPGTYGLLSGNSHDKDADYLFATMQTMAKPDVLNSFSPTQFEIIIIDEVHRAGSASYQKIMDHFRPDLFLGMTASPDRPDDFDIYKLFDNNIAQEIRLNQALDENLLCPFHYFGITDIMVDGKALDDMTDFSYLVSDERINHILKQADFYGYSGSRVKGLMFCRTNEEAQELSAKLNSRGLRTFALSGSNSQDEREHAINRLVADKEDSLYPDRLDYILTVNIFNEGVDIPEVNQVVMLRPTKSPIVFVQQLGRGLRKASDKDYVVVLDFIGNYDNNFMIPLALSGNRSYNKDDMRKFIMEGSKTISGSSTVHFDEISQQRVFESIDNTSVTLKLLKENYRNLKYKLDRIPYMVDFQEYGEIDPMLFVEKQRSYYRFLAKYEKQYGDVLSEDEQAVLQFLSRYMANGMRPHELVALQMLLDGKSVDFDSLKSELSGRYALDLDKASYDSTISMLDKSFINGEGDRKAFDSFSLIHMKDGLLVAETDFYTMLENPHFEAAIRDIVDFGLRRYENKYKTKNGDAFKLYEKYTRKDACRLLNWPQNDSSTVYGYRIKHNTCPIFVTYNKQDDIASSTQYEDEFIDKDTFSWMTRSRLKLDSPEVQKIINAQRDGLKMHLFIKKSDDEGRDFYYMGPVAPRNWAQQTILDDNGKNLPIVNFTLQLENTVQDDIYDYFAAA